MLGMKESVDKYIEKGNICFNKNKYEEAERIYTKAIKLCANNPYLYYLRHKAYFELKDFEQALKDIDMAIYMLNVQYNALIEEVEDKSYKDKFEDKDYIFKALSITKNELVFFSYLSKCSNKQGIIQKLNRNDKFIIKYMELLCNKIEILKQLNKYDEALYYLDILLGSGYKLPFLFILKADILSLKNCNIEAIDTINKIIDNDAENSHLYCVRSRYNLLLEKYGEVEKDITNALSIGIDKDDIQVAVNLLDVLTDYNNKQKQYEKSLELVTKAVELASDKAHYYLMRGGVLFNLEKYKEAKADIEKAMESSLSKEDKTGCEIYMKEIKRLLS